MGELGGGSPQRATCHLSPLRQMVHPRASHNNMQSNGENRGRCQSISAAVGHATTYEVNGKSSMVTPAGVAQFIKMMGRLSAAGLRAGPDDVK